VDVVGHEAIGVDNYLVELAILGEPFQIGLIILIAQEGLLPPIPTYDDVIEQSGK
jgi:hypothetical protein